MINEHVATYLNDHLAGSVVAVELLQHLEAAYSGTPVQRFCADLRHEIEQDREQLKLLMSRLNVSESRTRQTAAWMTEKVTELKLRLDDRSGGDFRLFQAMEGLSLGIEGKRALWESLQTAAEDQPSLNVLDYPRLIARAREQRSRVDARRLELARQTLA